MTSQRLTWMDFVRGLCIALVVFVHTSSGFQTFDIPVPSLIDAFNVFMDPFRIPLLMFLSGMLLHKSLKKQGAPYFWGKFNLIFWPFLLWSPIIYLAEDRLTLEYLIKTPFTAPSVLWYLWFLCAYYVLAYFVNRFKLPLVPIIIACFVASAFLPELLRMNRFAFLFAMFLLGHMVALDFDRYANRKNIGLAGLAIAFAGAVWSLSVHVIKYDPVFVLVPLGLIAFILAFASYYRASAWTVPLEWVGRNSMVFYAIHYPVIMVLLRLYGDLAQANPVLFYLAIFAVTMLAGVVVQLVRERVSLVAGLFDFSKLRGLWQARTA